MNRESFKTKFTKWILTAAVLIAGFGQSINAQNTETANEELKLTFQVRPRCEVRNGLYTPILITQQPGIFVSQRNRIGLNYSKDNLITVGLTMQVINVWGNDAQVQQTANTVSLFEAWAQLQVCKNWSLKTGRQIFNYDDERILGPLDWNNAARKHDAALLRFTNKKFKADVAGAYNQNTERVNGNFYNDTLSQPYKYMQFLWMKYELTKSISFSALAINIGKQNRSDSLFSNLQTAGANVFFKNDKVNATASFYYQTGLAEFKSKKSQTTNPWMASLYGTYNISKKFTAGIGTDYLTGKAMDDSTNTVTNFNPLYGTHHKFYGHMDYFYVASGHKNTGLWDSYLNAAYKPTATMTVQLIVHHFISPVTILDFSGKSANTNLGNEADVVFQKQIKSGVKIMCGYSQMFATTSMKYVKGIPDTKTIRPLQCWAWASININPEVLLFKKSN